VNRGSHRHEDIEYSRARFGFFSIKDRPEGFALDLVRPLVNDYLKAPTTLVNRARPRSGEDGAQTVETGFAKVPFVNLKARYVLTIAMCGWGIELTWAAIVTIAIRELACLDFPIDIFHDNSFCL
jgi:hypothetical protein